jgi:uncharacterized protein
LIYLDTSALAKAYISEVGSDEIRDLLVKSESPMCVSTLSLVEFRCAVGRRVRAGSLTEAESQRILSSFQSDLDTEVFDVLPIDNAHHLSARRLIDAIAPLPLKALDALHLAVLQRTRESHDIAFITSDAQQAQAARTLGVTTQTIALKI